MAVDYKQKYLSMRSILMSSVDTAFRLGYEQGMKDAQMEQQQMAMAQQQALQQGQMAPEEQQMEQQGDGQQEVTPQGEPVQAADLLQQLQAEGMDEDQQEQPQMDDLKSKLDELEQLVAKGEGRPSVKKLRKSIEEIKSMIKAKTPKKKEKTSPQKQLIDSLISKWEKEEQGIKDDLETVIKEKGLKL